LARHKNEGRDSLPHKQRRGQGRRRTDPSSICIVARTLKRAHGTPSLFNRRNPFEELLFIVCSIQTNEALYRQTFARLRQRVRTFDQVRTLPLADLVNVLKGGGMATRKARQIKAIATRLYQVFGRVTLRPLRKFSDCDCESFLTSLNGVGKKTARCVMMTSLGREVFPVDTHVWRIARRLGWVRATRGDLTCTQEDMDRLQSLIPAHVRRDLHYNLIAHGRAVCLARNPKCGECCISRYCRARGSNTR
jgi:endonuclease-3